MTSTTSVQLLGSLIGNPVTRTLLASYSHHCEADGGNRLEVALEHYLGLREDVCLRCRLAEAPLASLLSTGGKAFGVTEEDLKRTFQDPYWRKGLLSVVKGISEFGMKRPFVPGAPFQVVWDVTYACNLRCKHCYASAGEAHQDELTTAEGVALIDRLAAMGVPIIAFSGGEPLVRPDLLELAKHAEGKGMFVALATNGTLLTPEKVAALKENGVGYLQISLDGADAAVHDGFRGVPGAFDRTVGGIRNAIDQDLFVNISTTVTRNNIGEVPQIIDLCGDLGVNWFMAYNFIPAGRGRNMIEEDLSPEQREELLEMLYHRNDGSKMQVLTTAPQFARVALQQSGGPAFVPTHFFNQKVAGDLMGLTEFVGGCGAGRFYMAIRANGDVDPCVFFHHTVGNVRRDDLEDLWRHDPFFASLRDKDSLRENCGSCDYRHHCGGCRARAYSYSGGDHLAPDPGCVRNAQAYRDIRSMIIKDIR
ncbi:radical SAM/SPASM domain-containing protein [Methanomassiliicoccus luminyensis]|uniref:radical SAM/SPASM domain-containing protein n=1 Tax=Methanomassiliicoccus luminyensis TaxID=1080712 RepID=UPI000A905689|nr:radical SAM protein [Methanomassiliicoccus luminyensis]